MQAIHHTTDPVIPSEFREGGSAIPDARPHDWITRGVLVGLTLGASAGTIIPIYGTTVGTICGAIAGFGIGLAMSLFAVVSRNLKPADPEAIELRERFACLAIIWIPVFTIGAPWVTLAIPAALGSIHALAAGTPHKGHCYTGTVSPLRGKVCYRLPGLILALIATGWLIFLIGSWLQYAI